MLGIHTPPINVPNMLYEDQGWWQKIMYQFYRIILRRSTVYPKLTNWNETHESNENKKIKNPWISKRELNLGFGTINHFSSQFFYLCLGFTEAQDKKQQKPERKRHTIDLVLAGHAHRNIEFSIEMAWNNKKEENGIRIYSDLYSSPPSALEQMDTWQKRPMVIQTAGCGPTGDDAVDVPYYRKVDVKQREIKSFVPKLSDFLHLSRKCE